MIILYGLTLLIASNKLNKYSNIYDLGFDFKNLNVDPIAVDNSLKLSDLSNRLDSAIILAALAFATNLLIKLFEYRSKRNEGLGKRKEDNLASFSKSILLIYSYYKSDLEAISALKLIIKTINDRSTGRNVSSSDILNYHNSISILEDFLKNNLIDDKNHRKYLYDLFNKDIFDWLVWFRKKKNINILISKAYLALSDLASDHDNLKDWMRDVRLNIDTNTIQNVFNTEHLPSEQDLNSKLSALKAKHRKIENLLDSIFDKMLKRAAN